MYRNVIEERNGVVGKKRKKRESGVVKNKMKIICRQHA